MTTCTDEARCQDFPLCRCARRGFSLDDGDTGASFWPPLCPPEPLSELDGAGRQEGPFQAATEAYSECPACGCPNECAEVARLRDLSDKWGAATLSWAAMHYADTTALTAEVARLLAEIDDRESERADLRDRVTKAEPALERVKEVAIEALAALKGES